MCGIVGIFSSGGPVSLQALTAATAALEHRGPDGCRTWVSPDGRAGLGHTRLSIVAPDGIQPIASEDGQHQLVVNGEFYDFASIRRQLRECGHRFQGETDSEIGVHLYEERGPACLEQLRGEFALVLWDAREGVLFAARDRFGIKPLFYAQVGNCLVLASEAKALFAAGHRAAWDHETVYEQLFGAFRSDRSLFSGVRQVPPGHYLYGPPGAVRLIRYWDGSYPPRRSRRCFSEAECVARVRDLLTEAVRLRMQAHAPVGYLLSGGLDSSAVLSLAAARSAQPVQAFTVAFPGAEYDESAKARASAAHAGADLHVVPVSDLEVAENFAESVRHGEMIQYNAHGTARFILSREIQKSGYRAVMAGEGADELFAGYGFVRPLLPSGQSRPARALFPRILGLLGPLSESEALIAGVSPLMLGASRVAGVPEATVRHAAAALHLVRSVLSPEFAEQFRRHDPYWACRGSFDLTGKVWGREPAKQLIYLWLRSVFASYHMAADRLDMAHAVEVRLPFLDHKLFEYAARIPVSLLARDGRRKHVLREAARPWISDEIYRGAKQPFYAPPSASQPGTRLHEFVRDTLASESTRSLPFFRQREMLRLVDGARNIEGPEQRVLDPLLMTVTSLCLLQDQLNLW